LGLVATGFAPRWLCIPHWYVSFSIASTMPLINGGEQVAEILTALLIPMCLGDTRWWHWAKPTAISPVWRGSAYAAHVVLRIQVVIIYAEAALSKLAHPAWRHGTAVPILLNDPANGLPFAVRPVANEYLGYAVVGHALTRWVCSASGWS
jgi:antimicrobial peptide system SdpB family protein